MLYALKKMAFNSQSGALQHSEPRNTSVRHNKPVLSKRQAKEQDVQSSG
jgi:hypothetical protein